MKNTNAKSSSAVALGILALAVCVSKSWAAPIQVELEVHSVLEPFNPEAQQVWPGTATIRIDGEEYEGTLTYEGISPSVINEEEARAYGFGISEYDFPGLGSFKTWEIWKTRFEIVDFQPDPFHLYRRHALEAINYINEGTGAFEGADGVLHVDGYTEFSGTDPLAIRGEAVSTARGQYVPEPSTLITLLSMAPIGLLAFGRRRQSQ